MRQFTGCKTCFTDFPVKKCCGTGARLRFCPTVITRALTPVNPAGGGHLWSTNDMENEGGGPETSKCVTLALSGRSVGGGGGTVVFHRRTSAASNHILALGAGGWVGGPGQINVTDKGQGSNLYLCPPSLQACWVLVRRKYFGEIKNAGKSFDISF